MGVVFRQSALGTIITLVGAAIGFVSTFFIITVVLTPDQLGLTRLLVEIATLIGGFALLATQSSAIRYYPYFQHGDRGADRGFYRILLRITAIGFLLFSLLYILFRGPLVEYFSQSDTSTNHLFGSYYWMVLPLMLFIMYQTIIDVYCSLRQRVFVPRFLHDVLLRVLLIVAYVSYPLLHLQFTTFLWVFVGCYGLASLLLFAYSIRLSPDALGARILLPEVSVRRDYLQYTSLTLLSALGSTIVSRIDLFMVSAQMGLAFGGIYTIAFFIVAVIEMPSRSLLSMNMPQASKIMYENNYKEANRFFLKVSHQQVLVGTLLFIFIWINIDTIFSIIPHNEVYAKGKWVVFWLGIGKIIDLSFNFGNSFLRYSKYYVWTLAYTILVLVVTILTNYFLIRRLGVEGAAIGTLITYLLSYIFQQIILWRKMKISPLDKEMLMIYGIIVIVLLIDYHLPDSSHLFIDSIWKTLLLGGLTYAMLYRLPTFKHLHSQVLAALKRKKD